MSWWCANCLQKVELNIHGRCDRCESDAVDPMSRAHLRAVEVAADILVERLRERMVRGGQVREATW